ncbi:hypothetical protein [Streptomyces sp. NPDC001889]
MIALAVTVAAMLIGATVYVSYQHPRIADPIMAGGAVAVVIVGLVPMLYRRR